PTPENYELWYVYYSESNADIIRAIDILIANKQKITEEYCLDLHQRFLSEGGESDQVRKAGEKIQQTIKDVSGVVTKVKHSTARYSATLEDAADSLEGDMDQKKLQGVLKNIMSETQDMITHNEELEEQLVQSTQMMQ